MSEKAKTPLERRNDLLHGMIGLLVIWGSFYLVAKAQEVSSNKIRVRFDVLGARKEDTLLALMPPQAKGILQFNRARFSRTSRRLLVRSVLRQAGMEISKEDLALIPDDRIDFSLGDQPLYGILQDMLKGTRMGFALRADRADLFNVDSDDAVGEMRPPRDFVWRGSPRLTDDPAAIFPQPAGDLWLTLCFSPPLPLGEGARRVRLDYGRGKHHAGSGMISVDGSASQSFTVDEKSTMTLALKSTPEGSDGGLILCDLTIQDDTATGRRE